MALEISYALKHTIYRQITQCGRNAVKNMVAYFLQCLVPQHAFYSET